MKFRKDNQYVFGQDMQFYKHIPHGVDFEIEKVNDGLYKAIAFGYGILEKEDGYGNGAIYIYPKRYPYLKKRLQENKLMEGKNGKEKNG